jgi:hypothetical protein
MNIRHGYGSNGGVFVVEMAMQNEAASTNS